MGIKKFLIKLYQVILDFVLFNSGSKVKWGPKKNRKHGRK